MDDRIAFQKAINANPCDHAPQLVYADWLDEHGDHRKADYWRRQNANATIGRVGRVGFGGFGGSVGLVGLGGLGGLIGLVGLGGLIGRVGLSGRVRRGGLVGLVGLVGRGGRGGLGWLGGLGGRLGLFHPENQIVLIQGENVVVFMSDGYYVSVLVGHVAQELPHGWIVDPCRELMTLADSDTLIELALGKKSGVRKRAKFSDPIEAGFRVPFGCFSMVWHGELP